MHYNPTRPQQEPYMRYTVVTEKSEHKYAAYVPDLP